MAITKKRQNEIIQKLRELGGQAPLNVLSEAIGQHVNGLSQTLNGTWTVGVIIQDAGRGGSRIIRLVEN